MAPVGLFEGMNARERDCSPAAAEMRPDVLELETFYASRPGQLARRLLTRQIRLLWPDLAGQRVLGLGYTLPFMTVLAEGAERACVIMPHTQGSAHWPAGRPNRVALAADDDLPLPDRSIDRVLMVHALEATDQVRPLMREVWRILADGGEAIVVVPNRRGLWCLNEDLPFGHGRPYSSSQLKALLRASLFSPKKTLPALFVPPIRSRLVLRTALAWERVGQRWARHFAGVLLMLAEKQIYAAPVEPAVKRRRMPAYVPVPRVLAAAERVSEQRHRADG
jgi:SAM-dependent methyltransferase